MPPKTPQKPKATAVAKTAAPKVRTPAKKKELAVYKQLQKDEEVTLPVEVTFEGNSAESKPDKEVGSYTHVIKLNAYRPFTLFKTILLTHGEFEGQQAILIRPAKAFPFLRLPVHMRKHVYDIYFAAKGVIGDTIRVDSKHRVNASMVAKLYADGQKHRLGLMSVNQEIHEEARPLFYAHNIAFESTSTLLDWLSQIPSSVRQHLTSVEVKQFIKTSSRNALHQLAESKHLRRLHIDTGICSDADPVKAAKAFYTDAYKFLEEMGSHRGSRTAGVDLLTFGPGKRCFAIKEGKKDDSRAWSADELETFREELRKKLRDPKVTGFAMKS